MTDQSINLTRARGMKIGNWMFVWCYQGSDTAYCSFTACLVTALCGNYVGKGSALALRLQLYNYIYAAYSSRCALYSKLYLNLFTESLVILSNS